MRKKYGDYYVTIGLEIHVALQTNEKLFSSTQNSFETEALSFFDAGTPGVLPVLSQEPVEMAIAFGLAVNADIKKTSIFERKHYFYPDLPLGYQITQQHDPILIGGTVKIKDDFNQDKIVQIEHAHLECDAAKSMHDLYAEYTAIDLSRCASPLLEIVSTPCMHSPKEAKEYVKAVHSLVTYMNICDGKLEEGSFRVDASISLSKTEKLGTRVEVKNISSFSFLEQALEYEIERQTELLDKHLTIQMETRLFNEKDLATYSMRQKETVEQYRYMPDPDIIPLVFDDSLIEHSKKIYKTDYFSIKAELSIILERFGITLKEEELSLLLGGPLELQWRMFIKEQVLQTEKTAKLLAFWLPEVYAKLTLQVYRQLTKNDLLALHCLEAKECKQTIEKWLVSDLSLEQCMPIFYSDEEIKAMIGKILSKYDEQVAKYLSGEIKMLQFIMGKTMAELKGKSSASTIKLLLEEQLKSQ